ncbi:MAG: translation elongation factor 4 [Pelolinea sp.]|nr:translation elongation factor 4 [Pelolinea sp.]
MQTKFIRNFCIIAHIDHGKSTLADRILQVTGTVSERDMVDQLLDTMDLEREKGVTIKASAVRMAYSYKGVDYELNLIDTPGHVDFNYEVSRALAACEGALLVVDATQGIEAQTLANLYLALESDLVIIPVLNKIDLPSSRPDEVAEDLSNLLGIKPKDMIQISAKQGLNIEEVLKAIIEKIPPPRGEKQNPTQALIFDSHYDSYKGVVAYIRLFEGSISVGQSLRTMAANLDFKPVEIGVFNPGMKKVDILEPGDVGYIASGLKSVSECRVGDTITSTINSAKAPLHGYKHPKPMVYAGVYPVEGESYEDLKEAFAKLQLNDASLVYEPETSQALNFGFRCGFLGLFHMEIIQERLEREYNLDIVLTAPTVEYEIIFNDGKTIFIDSPVDLPDEGSIGEIREPWMDLWIFTPTEFYGSVMEIVKKRNGIFIEQEYPAPNRVQLHFEVPLSEIIVDFFDDLKSKTRGYASMDYQFREYRPGNLVKLEVLIGGDPVDALASIVHKEQAYSKGQKLVTKLKRLIPRQMYEVAIQASSDGRVISRATVKALRKDVLSKCYGGDVSRKRKLLEKQKKGKKRMKRIGNIEIPQEAFMAVLQLGDD